jgi:hypothetical protein
VNTNDFRPLPETFRHGGFDCRVVKRQSRVVLVQKTKPNLPKPMFEVAVVRLLPAQTPPSGKTSPPREAMPRDEDFGKTAWDFAYSRERAEAALARLASEAPAGPECSDSDPRGGILTPPEHQNAEVLASREKETAFQLLPDTWEAAGWRFRLLKRSGKIALVAKSKGGRDAFEVVIVQRQPARTWPSGRTTPAKETMPGDEQWGTCGWSPGGLTAAEAKFRELATTGGAV